jgi:exodeoxyribonuclease VII small subunit
MADENYNFTQARTRLEEIVAEVRKKDLSLEKSLDLLEEGVRLANICTEQSDHAEWRSVISDEAGDTEERTSGEESDEVSETAEVAEGEELSGKEEASDDDASDADDDAAREDEEA